MKRNRWWPLRVAWVLTIALGWAAPFAAAGSATEHNGIRHVLLIILDGVRPDALQQASTPNIDELAAAGAHTWNAWTTSPPVTIAAMPSIFSGAPPEVHRVQRWSDRMQAESIVEVLERAGLQCAVVGQSAVLGGQAATFHSDFEDRADYLEHFTQQALQCLEEHKPFFIAVYNPVPDKTAHQFGHQSLEYRRAIEQADVYIGKLMDALKRLGVFHHTLIVITTDHGMTGRSHSLGQATDMRIFSIWHGPGIKAGYEMLVDPATSVAHHTWDIAPTITALLSLDPPRDSLGKPLLAIFSNRSPTPSSGRVP
jgi:arylsulfatase A-like enzyme